MALTTKPIDRIDGRLKVTGDAKYVAEFNQKGMVYAFPVRATIAKGTLKSFDLKKAKESKGVIAILTHENAPKLREMQPEEFLKIGGFPIENIAPLQDNSVHYFGQYIAVVIAETYEQARAAAQLVEVSYAKGSLAIDLKRELPNAEMPEKIQNNPAQINVGKAEELLRQASVSLENTYSTSTENHHPMEPHATIAIWEGEEKVLLYHSTQGVINAKGATSYFFNLKPENVRVVSPYLGGAFGSKGQWGHFLLAAMAGKVVKRPVKLAITRHMMQTNTGRRAATIQSIALGTDKTGKLAVIRHRTDTYSNLTQFFEPSGRPTAVLYAAPLREITYRVANLNVGPPTFMRAPGNASGSFALECAVDEMANELKMDPIEFRRINHTPNDPLKNHPFSSEYLLDCYRIGAEKFGWSRRALQPRMKRNGNYLVGYGMATATYSAYRSSAAARIRMNKDGSVVVMTATQDLGTGAYTIIAQTAADALGIDMQNIKVEIGDSDFPGAPISARSQTTASVNPAVLAAGETLKKELLETVIKDSKSVLYQKNKEEIGFADGKFHLNSDKSVADLYSDIIKRSGKETMEACVTTVPETGPGQGPHQSPCLLFDTAVETNSDEKKYSFNSFGAHFAEVWVDEDLGTIKVKGFTSVQDVGRIMNEKTARSQVIGAVIYAVGQALMEETLYDHRWGNPVTRTLADYHVPVNLDIPPINVHFIGKPDPHISPIGARGLGEIGGVGVAAAIANAVYNATGKRIRDLPLTLDKILRK